MKLKQIIICLVGITTVSFFLNFLWESVHGFSLYIDHIIDSDKYVRMMLYMSLMDALTVLGMYLCVAFFVKNVLWINELNKKSIIGFFIIGLVAAMVAEYWSVYISGDWQYNDKMPMLFGIGISPLFQLSITGLTSLWVTRQIIIAQNKENT